MNRKILSPAIHADKADTRVKYLGRKSVAAMKKSLRCFVSCCSTGRTIRRLSAACASDSKLSDPEIQTIFSREAAKLSTYSPGASTVKKYTQQLLARIDNENNGVTRLPLDGLSHLATFLDSQSLANASDVCNSFNKIARSAMQASVIPRDYFHPCYSDTVVGEQKVDESKDATSVGLSNKDTLLHTNTIGRPFISAVIESPIKQQTLLAFNKMHFDMKNVMALPYGYFAVSKSYSTSYSAGEPFCMTIMIGRISSDKAITFQLPTHSHAVKVNALRVNDAGNISVITSDDKITTIEFPEKTSSKKMGSLC